MKFRIITQVIAIFLILNFHLAAEEKKSPTPQKNESKSLKIKKCPEDMIRIPGGIVTKKITKEEKQISSLLYLEEFCVDPYEYPDKKGELPSAKVTWFEADIYCKKIDKRLCSGEEWEKSCAGKNWFEFSYGNTFESKKCGISDKLRTDFDKSGSHKECVSSYGVYDMIGNVWEWTNDPGNGIYVKRGGYVNAKKEEANCFFRLAQDAKSAGPQDGFRCCKDVNPEAE